MAKIVKRIPPGRKSGELTGVKKRRKAARAEVKKRGRFFETEGMPKGKGYYTKTKSGKQVRKKKPPKSMK